MATFWDPFNSSSLKDWDVLDPADDELKKYDFPFSELVDQSLNSHLLATEIQSSFSEKIDGVSGKKEKLVSIKKSLSIPEDVSFKYIKPMKKTEPTITTHERQRIATLSRGKMASEDAKDGKTVKSRKTYSKKKQNPLVALESFEQVMESSSKEIKSSCPKQFQIVNNEQLPFQDNSVSKSEVELAEDLKLTDSEDADYSLFGDFETLQSYYPTEEEKSNVSHEETVVIGSVSKGYQRTRKNLKKQIITSGLNGELLVENNANTCKIPDASFSSSNKESSHLSPELGAKDSIQNINNSNFSGILEKVMKNKPPNNSVSSAPKLSLMDMVKRYSENHNSPNGGKSDVVKKKRQADKKLPKRKSFETLDSSLTELPQSNKKAKRSKHKDNKNHDTQNGLFTEEKNTSVNFPNGEPNGLGESESDVNKMVAMTVAKKHPQSKSKKKSKITEIKATKTAISEEHSEENIKLPSLNFDKGKISKGSQKKRKRKGTKSSKPKNTSAHASPIECATQTSIEMDCTENNDSFKVLPEHLSSTPYVSEKYSAHRKSPQLHCITECERSGDFYTSANQNKTLLTNSVIPCYIPNDLNSSMSVNSSQTDNAQHVCSNSQLMWLPVYGKTCGCPTPYPLPAISQFLGDHIHNNHTSLPNSVSQHNGNGVNYILAHGSEQPVVNTMNVVDSSVATSGNIPVTTQSTSKPDQRIVITPSTQRLNHEANRLGGEKSDNVSECFRSFALRGNDFLTYIAEKIEFLKKGCILNCKDAQELFAQHPNCSSLTVREFCENSDIMEILSEFSVLCSDFEKMPGHQFCSSEYEFPEGFQDAALVMIMKDFVDCVITQMFPPDIKPQTIYVSNRSILKFAYQNMSLRECVMMSMIFNRSEMLKIENLAAKLAIVAILLIFNTFQHSEDRSGDNTLPPDNELPSLQCSSKT